MWGGRGGKVGMFAVGTGLSLFVLALLVHVTFVLALPGQEVGFLPARVERDEEVRAEVPVRQVELRLLKLSLSRLHPISRAPHFVCLFSFLPALRVFLVPSLFRLRFPPHKTQTSTRPDAAAVSVCSPREARRIASALLRVLARATGEWLSKKKGAWVFFSLYL